MRLFVALEIPLHVREALVEWQRQAMEVLNPHAWRVIPERNWHLTLAFYGEVSDQTCDVLGDALHEYILPCVAPVLHFSDVGVFPRPARPRTFWIGVDDAAQPGRLKQLARCCRQAGHATLRKRSAREEPFRGHITLARAGREKPAPFTPELWRQMPDLPPMIWRPTRLCLFRSWLRPEGARYACVQEFDIEGDTNV